MLEKIDIRIRAIMVLFLTTAIGVPVMLSYSLILFSLFTTAASIFKYAAISVSSVVIVLVLIHIYVILRVLRPLSDFLRRPQDGKGDQAVRATIVVPLVSSGFSLITWPVGTFCSLVFLSFLVPLPMSELMRVVAAGICAGIFVTLIQYYLTKLILGPERRKITEIYPDYWKNPANRPRFGVRYSILVSSMLLILASLLFAGIMNYSQASLALIRQVGKERVRELKLFAHYLESAQTSGGWSEDIFNQLPKDFADGIYLIDRKGLVQLQRGDKTRSRDYPCGFEEPGNKSGGTGFCSGLPDFHSGSHGSKLVYRGQPAGDFHYRHPGNLFGGLDGFYRRFLGEAQRFDR